MPHHLKTSARHRPFYSPTLIDTDSNTCDDTISGIATDTDTDTDSDGDILSHVGGASLGVVRQLRGKFHASGVAPGFRDRSVPATRVT